MKTTLIKSALALLALSTLNPQLSTAFAQGSLTPPPGAPAPTMLTLNQVEPRTPISSAPFTITQPGSYYLTGNLTVTGFNNAISINTNGVTLDLNGFTISSTGSSSTAIVLNEVNYIANLGNSDITIYNGHITGGVTYTNGTGTYGGPGFANGISYSISGAPPAHNVRVTGVSVSGCSAYGIDLGTGNSTVVESCTVNTVGGYGIVASGVSHSTAIQCGNTAISADTASDCYGYCTGGGDGLNANYAASNCYGVSSSGAGIYVNDGNANSCYGNSSSGVGLEIGYGNANNCYGYSNGSGTGIYVESGNANNCYGSSNTSPGLSAGGNANSCIGVCLGGTSIALVVSDVAIGCVGNTVSAISPAGISAFIAIGCISSGNDSGITYKYNMP